MKKIPKSGPELVAAYSASRIASLEKDLRVATNALKRIHRHTGDLFSKAESEVALKRLGVKLR